MVQPKPFHRLIDALWENASAIGTKPALYGTSYGQPRGTRADTRSGRSRESLLAGGDGEGTSINWRQLAAWVTAIAGRLEQLRLDPKRLVHCVSNRPADLLIGLACQAIGIVEAPVDSDGGADYLAYCRDQVGAHYLDPATKLQIVDDAWTLSTRQPWQDGKTRFHSVGANDDALILWTSGTSGRPKGVVLSHEGQLHNAAAKLSAVPQSVDDRRLTVLSIAHAYSRTCDLGTWLLSGCSLAIVRGFAGWNQTCDAFEPTLCNLVPRLASRVLDANRIPASLRLVGCGGAALGRHQFDQFRQRGVIVIQGYGLTECGPVVTSQTPSTSIPDHAGRFVCGWQHRLDQGRLYVRGTHMMKRYWQDPAATEDRVDQTGWLDTGDRVQIDPASGQLAIQGRIDDRIVLSNGHNVYPQPIENRFLAIPQIQTAVLVADPDRNSIDLWVESDRSDLPNSEIDAIIETLPRWEQPRAVNRMIVPDGMRTKLFNRKGAIRRGEMLRFLGSATGS